MWAWLFDVRCSREWFKGKNKLGLSKNSWREIIGLKNFFKI